MVPISPLLVVVRNIHFQPSFLLKNLFHVSKLSNNLLFIHKVAQDLNCAVVFFHSHCVFQDCQREDDWNC